MNTSKQITIKRSIAERLDEMRNKGLSEEIAQRSYSQVIEELFKIQERQKYLESAFHVQEHENKQLHERIELLRLAKKGDTKCK